MAFVTTPDGWRLFVEERGRGTPLLLVHGFTGSSQAWGPEVTSRLARGFRLLCVDLLGHGRSDKPEQPRRYALAAMIHDLCHLLDARRIQQAIWMGYSMGGRIALGAAVLRQERVRALILESASPGLPRPEERAARKESDEELARMLETEGMEAFVAHWMSLPLFRTQARLGPARLEQERGRRLRNAPRSLAACLRGLGTGAQPSLWAALKDVQIPTRLLVGEKDPKFRHIAGDMADALPRASTHVVPGAGHATHLECPEAFVTAVRSFCENTIEARGDPKHEDAVDSRA